MEFDPYAGTEIDNDICEHGMSAWLCMGPMHYPSTEQEMRGEYF